jgi:hypothetical protein
MKHRGRHHVVIKQQQQKKLKDEAQGRDTRTVANAIAYTGGADFRKLCMP